MGPRASHDERTSGGGRAPEMRPICVQACDLRRASKALRRTCMDVSRFRPDRAVGANPRGGPTTPTGCTPDGLKGGHRDPGRPLHACESEGFAYSVRADVGERAALAGGGLVPPE